MNRPEVSVIIPAFNAEAYIREAIKSILQQTYQNFELIIIDDGSTDNSRNIIESLADSRTRVVEHNENQGLIHARNIGLTHARGKFIAWLDADDISHPRRLEKQVQLMQAHPKIGICGTWVRTIGKIEGNEWCYPVGSATLKARMVFDDPFATSSVMLRKDILDRHQLVFDMNYPLAEDYDMWIRVAKFCNVTNIPEILTYYRIHGSQTSDKLKEVQNNCIRNIYYRGLEQFNILPTEAQMETHYQLGLWQFQAERDFIERAESWLSTLSQQNAKHRIFPSGVLERVLLERWFLTCQAGKNLPGTIRKTFLSSPLALSKSIGRVSRLRQIARAWRHLS